MTYSVYCLISNTILADRLVGALRVLGFQNISMLFRVSEPGLSIVWRNAAPSTGRTDSGPLDIPAVGRFTVIGSLLPVWIARKPSSWIGVADAVQEIGISAADAVFIVRFIRDGYGLIVVQVDHPRAIDRVERMFAASEAAENAMVHHAEPAA